MRRMTQAWDHLLPGMGGGTGSTGELKRALRSQERPHPAGGADSPLAKALNGKTWNLESNQEGIATARVSFKPDRVVVELDGKMGKLNTLYGLKGWVAGSATDETGKRPTAGRCAWTSPNRLAMKLCVIDSPYEWSQELVFDGDKLTVEKRAWNVFFGPGERPTLVGRKG